MYVCGTCKSCSGVNHSYLKSENGKWKDVSVHEVVKLKKPSRQSLVWLQICAFKVSSSRRFHALHTWAGNTIKEKKQQSCMLCTCARYARALKCKQVMHVFLHVKNGSVDQLDIQYRFISFFRRINDDGFPFGRISWCCACWLIVKVYLGLKGPQPSVKGIYYGFKKKKI